MLTLTGTASTYIGSILREDAASGLKGYHLSINQPNPTNQSNQTKPKPATSKYKNQILYTSCSELHRDVETVSIWLADTSAKHLTLFAIATFAKLMDFFGCSPFWGVLLCKNTFYSDRVWPPKQSCPLKVDFLCLAWVVYILSVQFILQIHERIEDDWKYHWRQLLHPVGRACSVPDVVDEGVAVGAGGTAGVHPYSCTGAAPALHKHTVQSRYNLGHTSGELYSRSKTADYTGLLLQNTAFI